MSSPDIVHDSDFTDYALERVEGNREDGWSVTFDGAIGVYVPSHSPIVPEVGMTIRLYGRGFGYPVRGLYLNGVRVFYRTEAEQQEHHRQQVEADKAKRRAEFEAERADMDRRYEALPPIFRARLDKFRRNNPDFRWEFEGYELFTCEQAVAFAETFKTPEALQTWARLEDPKEQHRQCPRMADGHSGNTFGCACKLAYQYLTTPENVERMHGALAPLVGSEEYGCVPRGAATA